MKQNKKGAATVSRTAVEKLDVFFDRHKTVFAVMAVVLSVVTGLLLFDIKVSLSGDDCDYILAARAFWNDFTYPGHHGALYPIILSPFVGLFGLNLFLLKFLSVLFMSGSFWLYYKSFENKIPAVILVPAMFFICINPHVLFFASYTYSEPLFMLFQALFFFLFSKYFWNENQMSGALRHDWKKYLLLAFVILCMGLTRTIGFSAIGIMVIYFAIQRKWKNILYAAGIFAVVFIAFHLLKSVIWSDAASVQSFEMLLAKNAYNPEMGMEDVSGLTRRFIENSHIYLQDFLFQYLGFASSSEEFLGGATELTWLAYILYFVSVVSVFRKNKAALFVGIYTGVMVFATFILLHQMWAQDRMLMIYYPYILLLFMSGLYYVFQLKRKLSFLFTVLLASLLIGNFIHAKNRIAIHFPILQQNITGNDLYGLTADWENFIKMTRWANDNLDKDAVIVSRKPTMSCVYTGRDFRGIYSVPTERIENVVQKYDSEKTDAVFIAVDITKGVPTDLSPFLQYMALTTRGQKFFLNDKEISAAGIYAVHRSIFNDSLTEWLQANGTSFTLDVENFLRQYQETDKQNYRILCPDVLYDDLKNNNVKYLLLPRIRVYTLHNTGQYIDTIHQYVNFVNLKYPNSFTLIHTIGKDEICELVEFVPRK